MAGREREEELARLIAQPFKLVGGGVPLRVYLLAEEGASGQAVLLFSAHHAIRCTNPSSLQSGSPAQARMSSTFSTAAR